MHVIQYGEVWVFSSSVLHHTWHTWTHTHTHTPCVSVRCLQLLWFLWWWLLNCPVSWELIGVQELTKKNRSLLSNSFCFLFCFSFVCVGDLRGQVDKCLSVLTASLGWRTSPGILRTWTQNPCDGNSTSDCGLASTLTKFARYVFQLVVTPHVGLSYFLFYCLESVAHIVTVTPWEHGFSLYDMNFNFPNHTEQVQLDRCHKT